MEATIILTEITPPWSPPVKGGEISSVPSPLAGEGKGEGYVQFFMIVAVVVDGHIREEGGCFAHGMHL